jgi:hypothetical protein
MKVAICTPTISKPYPAYLSSLEASVPVLDAAGIEHATAFEVGCPYISGARATLLGKALAWGADRIVFIDHDLGWDAEDLLKLIQSDAPVSAGLYRFRKPDVEYMGVLNTHEDFRPVVRDDGLISATRVPAGFLQVTRDAVDQFRSHYPELSIGDQGNVDLFNHGAIDGTWFGEDYAFSLRWQRMGGEIWVVPDLSLTHYDANGIAYHGNYHEFLMRQPK